MPKSVSATDEKRVHYDQGDCVSTDAGLWLRLGPPLLGYLPYPSAIPCVVPRSVVRGFVAEWSTEVGLGRNIGSDTGSSGYHDAGNVGRVNFSIP